MRTGTTGITLPLFARRGRWVSRLFNATGERKVEVWQAELDRVSRGYHRTGAWIAALLNPLFALNDLMVLPAHAPAFFLARCVVSTCIIAALRSERMLRLDPRQLVMVPFLLISLENAWMWSFMDAPLFRMHSLAYAVLFLGASMIVLWPLRHSLLVLAVSSVANAWCLSQNSTLSVAEIMVNGGTLLLSVALICTVLTQTRYRMAIREIVLRQRLEESNAREREQKAIIEANHKDLTSSIRYSQRIQQAILPGEGALKACFPEAFALHRPKDIVSGDFLWCAELDGRRYIAVADCTGHGVPGALMSMLGHSLLNKIVIQDGVRRTADILSRLREEVIAAQRHGNGEEATDGMDIALCAIDPRDGALEFSGAFNPAVLVRNAQRIEIAADRMPVGSLGSDTLPAFTSQRVECRPNDMLYLFSDGYADQFGGPQDRKFGRTRFLELLTELAPLDITVQQQRLAAALDRWKRDLPAVDDVLVVGIRL